MHHPMGKVIFHLSPIICIYWSAFHYRIPTSLYVAKQAYFTSSPNRVLSTILEQSHLLHGYHFKTTYKTSIFTRATKVREFFIRKLCETHLVSLSASPPDVASATISPEGVVSGDCASPQGITAVDVTSDARTPCCQSQKGCYLHLGPTSGNKAVLITPLFAAWSDPTIVNTAIPIIGDNVILSKID